MKLLILTQKVDKNDPILGFFVRWVLEFAKHCEKLTVICLEKGEYDLPDNVRVFSLGKEKYVQKEVRPRGEGHESVKGATLRSPEAGRKGGKRSFLARLTYIARFYKLIFSKRKDYDAVFVHMNQLYVILGGVIWWLLGKKNALWYAHGHTSFSLRIAEKLSDIIFTSTASGFRLKSKKVRIVGQGIDMQQFGNKKVGPKRKKWDFIRIIHVGRIAEAKNIHLILEAVQILRKDNISFVLTLVGSAITNADKKYEEALHSYIEKFGLKEQVIFAGNVLHADIADVYKNNDIAVNLSDTGSMDKSVLEAMAAGIQVLTSNEAFKDILPPDNQTTKSPTQVAECIQQLGLVSAPSLLKGYVLRHHSISALIFKILKYYE